MNIHKDFFGQVVVVGQYVAYSTFNGSLNCGLIVEKTNKMIRVVNCDKSASLKTHKRKAGKLIYAKNVILVDEQIVLLKKLSD